MRRFLNLDFISITKAAEELGVTVDETLLEGAAETFDSISK